MSDKLGRRLFKIGGAFLILLGLVHSISLFQNMAATNDTEKQLIDLMNNYRFDMMGSLRNMAELLRGFSVAFMISVLGLGILDLTVSGERTGLLKRVALINVLWMAAMLGNSLRYFFVLPTSFLAVATLIFVAAWMALPKEQSG
jgi:hypothetical protein